jgi:hypothetical protein
MSEIEKIAEAVQEVARFGEKSLETSEKVGGFFARVFQEPAEEVAGMITDKLRFVRWRRLLKMIDEVNCILSERGAHVPRAVAPKLALPIFEEASLEEDPTLQRLWSSLLANAMDPNFNGEIRYGFIDMIRNMTGKEIAILDYMYRSLKTKTALQHLVEIEQYRWAKEELTEGVAITEDDYLLSVCNLMRMQCVGPAPIPAHSHLRTDIGMERLMVSKGADIIVLTPLGVRFVQACVPEQGRAVPSVEGKCV